MNSSIPWTLLICLVSGHTPVGEYEDKIFRYEDYALDERFPSFIATRFAMKTLFEDQEGLSDISPPYMGDNTALVDYSPFGPLFLVQEMARGPSGSVHVAFVGVGFVSVKYMNDCKQRLFGLDPSLMLTEFGFLKVLNDTGLVPPVYMLSKEAFLGGELVPKAPYNGRISAAHYNRCVQLGTKVRYMVQELAGPTVQAFFDWYMEHPEGLQNTKFISAVITIGLKIVDLIEAIHDVGIVHGDINADNIAFKHPVRSFIDIDIESAELVLLDFGDSVFYPNYLNKPEKRSSKLLAARKAFLSMYQLGGFRTGPRDDIFQFVQMLANLCSRGRYTLGESRMVESNLQLKGAPAVGSLLYQRVESEVLLFVKSKLPMFEYSPPLASAAFVGGDSSALEQESIRRELEALVSHARSYQSSDEVPNYDYIRGIIVSILSRSHFEDSV